MNLVFSTQDLPAVKRYAAWQEALCALYVRVESRSPATDDYQGFVKEARFGAVTLTDCHLSPQEISRQRQHMGPVDKDCLYLALMQKGRQTVEQGRSTLGNEPGMACLFSAAEPYRLRNDQAYRALYVELPRAALAQRLAPGRLDRPQLVNTGYGMGRVLQALCTSLALEASTLAPAQRQQLDQRLLDLLALTLDGGTPDSGNADTPRARDERLRQVQAYIDTHLGNPLLNPERIAAAHQLSVRTLHYLFKASGQSVSDYLWERRLQRCRQELEAVAPGARTVTEIALASGFNSMSHFSSLFRRRFGLSPKDARGLALA